MASMSKRGITKGEPRAKVDRKHRSPHPCHNNKGRAGGPKEKHKPPQKLAREPRATEFALELRATGVEWGSLVACIVNLRT